MAFTNRIKSKIPIWLSCSEVERLKNELNTSISIDEFTKIVRNQNNWEMNSEKRVDYTLILREFYHKLFDLKLYVWSVGDDILKHEFVME